MQSVTNDSPLTFKMKRLLQAAAMIVFVSTGSIRDVFDVLQDHETRRRFISRIPATQLESMQKYIQSIGEIDESEKGKAVGTKYTLISGIVDRLTELEQNTYLERMLDTDADGNIDLVKEIQKNQLVCIRMPERSPTQLTRRRMSYARIG